MDVYWRSRRKGLGSQQSYRSEKIFNPAWVDRRTKAAASGRVRPCIDPQLSRFSLADGPTHTGRPDFSKAAVRNIDRLATHDGFTVILDKHKSGTTDLVGPAPPILL
jgi:hypothetical protein